MDDQNLLLILRQNLPHYRCKSGMSQAEVASNAKISLRLYSKIENGDCNPTIHTLAQLASAFKIIPSKLLSFDILRLEINPSDFIKKFSTIFEKSEMACGIRSPDGRTLYVNLCARELLGVEGQKNSESFNVINYLPAGAKEILKWQICSERYGNVYPYLNFYPDRKTMQNNFMRYYPCLILNEKGSEAIFTVVYMVDVNNDHHQKYYHFCLELLRCQAH